MQRINAYTRCSDASVELRVGGTKRLHLCLFKQSPVLPPLVQKHLEVLPPMTRWGCLQDDLARSGVRLPGGLRSLLMAGTSDASGVWLIGNPGRYDASVMVCDSCVKERGARAQNAQQIVGDL